MTGPDEFFDPYGSWDRERQEGPSDWGPGGERGPAPDPTDEEWAALQAEIDRERRTPPDSTAECG